MSVSRYFYDHGDSNPGKFSPHQLVEIRKSNLARVHCDNGDSIKYMQPLSFRKQSLLWGFEWVSTKSVIVLNFRNPLVPCDAITIPRINLLPWKEGLRFISPGPIRLNTTLQTIPRLNRVQDVNQDVGEPFLDLSLDRKPKENSFVEKEEGNIKQPSPDFSFDVNFGWIKISYR